MTLNEIAYEIYLTRRELDLRGDEKWDWDMAQTYDTIRPDHTPSEWIKAIR